MILKVLSDYYDALADQGKIIPVGWSVARVSFGLCLDEDGNLVNVYSLKRTPEGGKKELPIDMMVPEQIKKTSGIASYFLCENSVYLLGIGKDSKGDRIRQCFDAARILHHTVLDPYSDDSDISAVLKFFDNWDPANAQDYEVLTDYLDEFKKGAVLVLIAPDGQRIHEKEIVKKAWSEYRNRLSEGNKSRGRCLVTGEKAPIARLHPSIKGIVGAQSSGASLVSFNASAFESYGHEQADETGQGMNSPVSELIAFKYATALNYMTADKEHTKRLSEMTLIFWAEDAGTESQDLFGSAMFGDGDEISIERLNEIAEKLRKGEAVPYERSLLKGDLKFYVLGIMPNAARLAVSFYEENRFGDMLEKLVLHYHDLDLIKPVFAQEQKNTIWHLLYEASNKKSKDKKIPAPIISSLLYAVLSGTPYPEGLYENVLLRIRAEHDVNWRKAAIIKAYLLRLYRRDGCTNNIPEEVLRVELNKESDYVPYVLGREFAVLERIQQTANPDINTTIRDRYFTSASTTPAPIFAMLIKLTQHHMKKINKDRDRRYFDILLTELENRFHEPIPARLNLQDQGIFYLGYYHQKQDFFKKKEKENE